MGSRRRPVESQGNDKGQEAARKSPGTGMAHNGVSTATNGLTELPCSSPSCILASAATSTSPDMKIKRRGRYEHKFGPNLAIFSSGQSTRERGRVSKPEGRKTRRPGQEQAALRKHPRPSMGNIITTTPNVRGPLLLGVAMLLTWMPSTSLLAPPGALSVLFRVLCASACAQ